MPRSLVLVCTEVWAEAIRAPCCICYGAAAMLGTAFGKLGHQLGSKYPKSPDISFQALLPDVLFRAQISWLLVQLSFLINFKTTFLLLLLLFKKFHLLLTVLLEMFTSLNLWTLFGREIAVAALFCFSSWANELCSFFFINKDIPRITGDTGLKPRSSAEKWFQSFIQDEALG